MRRSCTKATARAAAEAAAEAEARARAEMEALAVDCRRRQAEVQEVLPAATASPKNLKQMAGKVAEARKTVASMGSERSAALNAAAAAKKQADDLRH